MQKQARVSEEVLYERATDLQRFRREVSSARNAATKTCGKSCGGRRSWLLNQDMPIDGHLCEIVDIVMEAGATEQETMSLVWPIINHIVGFYARKEVLPSVPEALRLLAHADADEDKTQSDALISPTPENMEREVEALRLQTQRANLFERAFAASRKVRAGMKQW